MLEGVKSPLRGLRSPISNKSPPQPTSNSRKLEDGTDRQLEDGTTRNMEAA